MVSSPSPVDLSQVPETLLQSVVLNAARDAEAVIRFLDLLCEAWRHTEVGEWLAKKPVRLKGEFLLGLSAALRLLAWESQGIRIHRDAGMSAALEALRDVFRAVTDTGAAERTAQLGSRVFTLSCERFAWNGWHDLKADIVLDYLTEDAALDALAEYVWANRHAGPVASCPEL